jgi:hypothetical protein
MITAVMKPPIFIRNTPALRTNNLKGIGGGIMLGINIEKTPYFLYKPSA